MNQGTIKKQIWKSSANENSWKFREVRAIQCNFCSNAKNLGIIIIKPLEIFSEFKKIKESFYKIVKCYENYWKFKKINENYWKFKKIKENVWKFMKINDDYQEIWTEIWVDT